MPPPSKSLPPAQPTYVFRGHSSQIHALAFAPNNSSLLTGDASGWVACWDLAIKRPTAVWRAHESAVLGLAWWGADAVISHGRDSKLVVWQLGKEAERWLDTTLPLEVEDGGTKDTATGAAESTGGRRPEVLYELTLNTLNFCAFAWCLELEPDHLSLGSSPTLSTTFTGSKDEGDGRRPILLALPHTLDSEAVDLYQLPSTQRLSTLPAVSSPPTGMAMALALAVRKCLSYDTTFVAAGYESGHVIVFANPTDFQAAAAPSARYPRPWQRLYASNPHTQPVLSLAAAADASYFLTSSADDVVAKHPFASLPLLGRITPPFTTTSPDTVQIPPSLTYPLREEEHSGKHTRRQPKVTNMVTKPLKLLHTKHAGQQGLSIRSDGPIFATAGWDGRVRVFSTTGKMREVAVLKWHKEGCYATALATVDVANAQTQEKPQEDQNGRDVLTEIKAAGEEGEGGPECAERRSHSDLSSTKATVRITAAHSTNSPGRGALPVKLEGLADGQGPACLIRVISEDNPVSDDASAVNRQDATTASSSLRSTVKERREQKARTTHWLAAGSKDGKVSLWNIC